jgi:hypothetical protein
VTVSDIPVWEGKTANFFYSVLSYFLTFSTTLCPESGTLGIQVGVSVRGFLKHVVAEANRVKSK